MAISVSFNGVVYSIPETGEESWGENVTSFLVAIPAGALQKSGGTFTLTADVNFGANFGLLSKYFSTRTALPSTAGLVRLAVTDTIGWKNNAGLGNLLLGVNASDQLVFNGTSIISNAITALTGDVTATGPGSVAATIAANAVSNAKFRQSAALSIVGNATNALANVADITAGTDNFALVRSGTSLVFALLVNANIDAAAAIAFSKLATLSSANILVGSAGNVATSVAVTGDVTISNAGVTAIGVNKVLDTMIRQSAGLSVIGNSTNSTANVADITAGTDNFVLRRSGTSLAFGLLVNANIDAAAAIAFSKLAVLSSGNILVGNVSNVAVSVAMSGDVTISNAGVTAIGNAKVTNAMLATAASAATASYVALRDANANLSANNFLPGYATTVTAAGTTTQTVVLPVASTLVLGQSFTFVNNSSGVVTVQSSGANSVVAMAGSSVAIVTCILTSGTSAASWNVSYSTAAAGGGSVTSVAMTVPTALFATSPVTGSPVTTSGTLAPTLATQSANTIFAGPTSGSAATPAFRLQVPADRPMAVTSQVTTYTATAADEIIYGSGSAFTVTLPTPVGITGKQYIIQKTDATLANIVTVSGTGLSTTLNTAGETLYVVSNGSAWIIMERRIVSEWTAYTSVNSSWGNSVVTYTSYYKRNGDSLDFRIKMVLSNTVSGVLSFTMAQLVGSLTGLTLDTTKLVAVSGEQNISVGTWSGYDNGAAIYGAEVWYYGSGAIFELFNNSTNTVNATAPFTWGNTDSLTLNLTGIPISGWNG